MRRFACLWALAAIVLGSPLPDGPASGHGSDSAAPAPQTSIKQIQPLFGASNKRVRVTYGSYTLPAFNAPKPPHEGGMAMPGMEHEGGMYDASNKNAPLPCTDCTLKHAVVHLTQPDGTISNYQNGVWLHHLTLAVVGPERRDLACPMGTKRIPLGMERILAVHNDRNETFYGVTGMDQAGLYIGKDDKFDLELMLKNDVNQERKATFDIEFEYVPGKPAGWAPVKALWMDIAPCSAHMSDIAPPAGQRQFTLQGPEWTSTIDGKIANTIGHMHDGGVQVQVLMNGKPVCTSNAQYDTSPDYQPSPESMKLGAIKSQHISRNTPCIAIGEIRKGDKLQLTAKYDFDKYKPLQNKIGDISHVMGVALIPIEIKS